MGFIPNEPDAALNDIQAEFDPVDFDIMNHIIGGSGVTYGCACTGAGVDMDVDVAEGGVNVGRTVLGITAAAVTLDAADGSNPRIDLVVADSSGSLTFRKGTAAATPVMPSINADDTVLCAVWVPTSATTIGSSNITDKRIFARGYVAIRKPADESLNSQATLQNDDDLLFHIGPDEVWRYLLTLFLGADSATPDMGANWSLPSGGEVTFNAESPAFAYATTADWVGYSLYDNAGLGLSGDWVSGLSNTRDTLAFMRGTLINGSTRGTANWQWRQINSNASNIYVREGSSLIAWRIR